MKATCQLYLEVSFGFVDVGGAAALERFGEGFLRFDPRTCEAPEGGQASPGRERAEAAAVARPKRAANVDGLTRNGRREGGLGAGLGVPVELARVVVHEYARLQRFASHHQLFFEETPAEAGQVRRGRWRWSLALRSGEVVA